MTLLLYGITIFINFFIGTRYSKDNRKNINHIIYFLSFIISFLLMAGYRNNSGLSNDLIYSEIEYKNVINGIKSSYEFGYALLMRIGGYFTKDFYVFRSYIIGFFLFIFFWAIKKWAPSPHYVIALFSIYLIILSAEQLRYFLGFVFFAVGISILIYSKNPKKKMYFNICIVLASAIHLSFLIYFIFNLKRGAINTKLERNIAITVLFICLIIFLNGNQIPGLSDLLNKVDNYKVKVYLNQSTNLGFLYAFVLHFSSIVLTRWSSVLLSKTSQIDKANTSKHIYKLNLLSVLFFPMFMLQLTFYRLVRNLLIINYFLYSEVRTTKAINFTFRNLLSIAFFLSVLVWIYIDLVITTPPESLLIPFFTDNIYI